MKKKINIKNSVICNIFKTGKIGAEKIGKSSQSVYKSKYDQEIEDFINHYEFFRFSDNEFFRSSGNELFQQKFSQFEIRLYTKACLFIKEYGEVIEDLYIGINSEKYKGDEKSFVDNIYDCSKNFEIHFPKAEEKKDCIEDMRCKYSHVQDSSVKIWIKLITYYSLINDGRIPFKRYSGFMNFIMENEMLNDIIQMELSEYLNVFNFVFINSFIDFCSNKSISISPTKNIENNTLFDYLLKKTANRLENNEVIIVLKSLFKDEKNNIDSGLAFLVENKESGAHNLLKIV